MKLNGHQAAGLVADRARPVAFLAFRFDAALILAEREVARPLLDARAVHAFDPPTARQHDNPLRRRVLMPVAHPADGLNGKDDRRFAALHLVVPLRIGGAHGFELIIGERALRLMADAIGVDIEMRIGNAGLGPGLIGLSLMGELRRDGWRQGGLEKRR